MSDPRVDACEHQKETDSGKPQCVFPGRPYYFCKTNRRDCVCPLGYTTTYDDPEMKPERPFVSSLERSLEYFHEHHITTKWDLRDDLDSFQLFTLLDLLQFRYIELAMMYWREGKYKKSHEAWAKHDAYRTIMHDLFPYRDGGGKGLNEEYAKIKREIAEAGEL